MQKVLIVGGGEEGAILLRTLANVEFVKIIGIVDPDPEAIAMVEARKRGIPVSTEVTNFLSPEVDVLIEVTNDQDVYERLMRLKAKETLLVSGEVASLMIRLIEEKDRWFSAWRQRQQELEAIIHSTHDGMIAVNKSGVITLFNRAAERITNVKAVEVLGKHVADIVPNTRLDLVLKDGKPQLNQKQKLADGKEIVTNRVPVKDKEGNVIGAVAVFRDISEIKQLTQKVVDLQSMRSLLQAIIDSFDDAISVVDTNGNGILINPAYTRLTGLTPDQVIGKPAEADIYEGESMHRKVLETREPVRGVQMKVGPHRRDVLVNVAPIILDGELKGSVAIIHDTSELKQLARDLEHARQLIRKLEAKYTFDDIIGVSEEMQFAIEQAKQAAKTRATVLLRGESGTGKELFAHAIHNASSRRYNQFIRVNCAALSESLLESELFGYEEGAFTGAKRGGKKGLFEEASGGTIFLDEIGELSPGTQAKLLRVLQEKEVIRVGGTKAIPVDVRVIAATNVPLEKAIQEKRFREDLYYRLNVFPIHIPPLRLRQNDLPLLALHIVRKLNHEYGRNVEEISPHTLEILSRYPWPGNVRELENVLGRAMIRMGYYEKVMMPHHLPPLEGRTESEHSPLPQVSSTNIRPLKEVLEEAERAYLAQVYAECQHKKTETAKRLGISVRSLYYKLEKYGLL